MAVNVGNGGQQAKRCFPRRHLLVDLSAVGVDARVDGIVLLQQIGLRNCFITVAERELMLLRSLTKRLVNHARPSDVTEGYAADWTVEQLREPAQRIADRIDELAGSDAPVADARMRAG